MTQYRTPANSPMADQPLPKHNPRLFDKSIEYATKFYAYDQQLTPQDRQRLSQYFWNRMFLAPLVSIPLACGFVLLPNALKRRKILLNPQKNYYFSQVFLGFVGLGLGQNLGSSLISAYQRQKLQSNSAALGAYNTLSIFPSQVGSQYFKVSAQNPKFIMKDPQSVDWSKNPLFPLFLVVNRDVVTELRHEQQTAVNQYREKVESQRRQEIQQRAGPLPTELTGTSWDSVIKQNETSLNPPNSTQSPSSAHHTVEETSSWASTPPTDDFTDSEKKW